jgi:hypothetical protein
MGSRCTGQQRHVEDRLLKLFPPGVNEMVDTPCVVVDLDGVILLWYLPGLVSLKRGVSELTVWRQFGLLLTALTEINLEFFGNY